MTRPLLTIQSEIRSEGTGWLVGSYLTRQLWSCLALIPLFLSVLVLKDSVARQVIIWLSFGVWAVWNLITLAVGAFFLSKQADKQYERKTQRMLSKEYRKD